MGYENDEYVSCNNNHNHLHRYYSKHNPLYCSAALCFEAPVHRSKPDLVQFDCWVEPAEQDFQLLLYHNDGDAPV